MTPADVDEMTPREISEYFVQLQRHDQQQAEAERRRG